MEQPQQTHDNPTKHLAFEFILLLGLVSALGDVTYETGRSVSGPYLAYLGASAAVVGAASGLGEFLGYALRLASGYLADRTRAYWVATFIGYGLILSIPLLAWTERWELAVLLLLLERIGKAIRSPARDTLLSHAAHSVGRGWGFALHEALDQIGAVAGPLIFSAVFLLRNSYRDAFTILWIPAILTIVVLFMARLRVPAPSKLEVVATQDPLTDQSNSSLPSIFWLYAAFTLLSVAGFANFQVISYHMVKQSVIPAAHIPALYAIAMGVDALAALAIGKAYDKTGMQSLIIVPFLTLPLPFLAFSTWTGLAIVSVVLWGAVMAVHETILRAAIADLIPKGRRALAYGIFNTFYGAAWFIGGAALGWLYEFSELGLILYVTAMELAALVVYFRFRKLVGRQILG